MEPNKEFSACGVGFVAARDGARTHAIVRSTLHALCCVEHRGAVGPDGLSSDGAGIMTEIPFEMLGHEPGAVALATLFLNPDAARRERALEVFENTFGFLGMRVLGYRDVPRNLDVLGERARADCPQIVQATLQRPEEARNAASFNARLYRAKQITRTKLKAADAWRDLFFVSLSTTTIIYKGLCRGVDLDQLYPDLANPRFTSRFGLFHRRFSTNTRSTWDKAQPLRVVSHNGEINTVAGNRSWAFSRERARGFGRDELLTREGISDSGSLNEMVEALKYRSSIPHIDDILAIMVPASDAKGDYYQFWGRAMEPWDGPALLAYSDGETVGARLDRNGFRPARWCMTERAFYLASEAGVFELQPEAVVAQGTLRAGSGVTVGIDSGKVHFRDPSESRENRGATFDPRLVPLDEAGRHLHPDAASTIEPPSAQLLPKQALYGVTVEELRKVIAPMIAAGKEPISSMGNTARPAIFSDQPRSFYDFFYQDFAQVTNPPLDYLRESMVTDLATQVGQRPNIFAPTELIPPAPALRLSDPILRLEQMELLRAMTVRKPSPLRTLTAELSLTYVRADGAAGLEEALLRLGREALDAVERGCSIVVLSDRMATFEAAPVPSLLGLRSVVTTLNRHGYRLRASLVVDAGDVRSTHALACAIGFGATAVCPRMLLEHARFEAGDDDPQARERRLIGALLGGLLKVMAKMGISVVRSYQSSKLFTPLGLGPRLVFDYFGTTPSPIGGLELPQLAEHLEYAWAWYERDPIDQPIPSTKQHKERKGAWKSSGPEVGERHSMTAERSKLVHDLVRDRLRGRTRDEVWSSYLEQGDAVAPVHPRDLLDLRPGEHPLALEHVEPASEILRRFGSGAMSFGAISAESQRDLFVAMRSVGARCNSGEGGENPYYFTDGITAVTKQIASGRFGVTAEYLVTGDEIEIKIAQGAKPGEGGQLMGVKVNEQIARARFARPGVSLISPPPMHDIYSIEDLAQLIFELKKLSPRAAICVKLVAGAHVGTIACGVVKAGADVVQISGGDGGTGAAPISSMKHAGLPWELGLIDAHARLVERGLRDKVRLRVDGGLSTPRDIVIAALLGAQEFGFGKALLIAQGCIMARVCEKNRCPTGIATHDPKFKAKYKGTVEHVVTFLQQMAEGVRAELAKLGARSLDEIIGRRRWLRASTRHEELAAARGIDIGSFLMPVPWSPTPQQILDGFTETALSSEVLEQLDAHGKARIELQVRSVRRAVGTDISGALARRAHQRRMAQLCGEANEPLWPKPHTIEIEAHGTAGQGLAAFAVQGMHVTLHGEANDGVAKSMSGGTIIIRPSKHATFVPERNAILGNGALYGATGGRLFAHGLAGDRFAVRNSGALAVVEGTGLHACEYMTGGVVVVLGELAGNAGAGMTGGRFYVRTDQRAALAEEYVAADPLDEPRLAELTDALTQYFEATCSQTARTLLDDASRLQAQFVCVWPIADPDRPSALEKQASG